METAFLLMRSEDTLNCALMDDFGSLFLSCFVPFSFFVCLKITTTFLLPDSDKITNKNKPQNLNWIFAHSSKNDRFDWFSIAYLIVYICNDTTYTSKHSKCYLPVLIMSHVQIIFNDCSKTAIIEPVGISISSTLTFFKKHTVSIRMLIFVRQSFVTRWRFMWPSRDFREDDRSTWTCAVHCLIVKVRS